MRIVFADDSAPIRKSLNKLLKNKHEIFEAADGLEAIEVCLKEKPDILITDIRMPKFNGFEVIERLKDEVDLRHTRFILVSVINNMTEKLKGYEIGAHEFMTKPFDMNELNAKIEVYSKLRKSEEIEEAFDYTISALARASQASDGETGAHIARVNEYSFLIARLLKMDDEYCKDIKRFAQMHDIGKVNVHPDILQKKGRLSEEEFHAIQAHPGYGAMIIGSHFSLNMAKEIALSHHEKWDGSGYPNGLKKDDIPLSGRIVALADVYDALRSERAYKPSFSHETTIDIIINGDDRIHPEKSFDPKLLNLFKENHNTFEDIYEKL
ncbi:MAG: hypothetical protein COA79_06940 [Planctomycetota bacterium]|nr:MAG: hypothetical protein COA79_06940 [Planctomycetota bacterium]